MCIQLWLFKYKEVFKGIDRKYSKINKDLKREVNLKTEKDDLKMKDDLEIKEDLKMKKYLIMSTLVRKKKVYSKENGEYYKQTFCAYSRTGGLTCTPACSPLASTTSRAHPFHPFIIFTGCPSSIVSACLLTEAAGAATDPVGPRVRKFRFSATFMSVSTKSCTSVFWEEHLRAFVAGTGTSVGATSHQGAATRLGTITSCWGEGAPSRGGAWRRS